MKHVLITLLSFLLMVVLSAATYKNTLSGSQATERDADRMVLNLTATGDLPGMSNLNLQRDGQNVVGGTWRMTVVAQNADASSSERGQLFGTITGGTLVLNAEGALASATSVQVVLQGGTGEFKKVTTGYASISIAAKPENSSQLNGTLVINF